MAEPSIFRREARDYEARPESIDELAIVTTPRDWLILTTLVVFFAISLCWVFLGTVETVVRTEAILQLPGERKPVHIGIPGRIEKLFVGEGSLVDEGERIAKLSFDELNQQLAGIRAQINLISEVIDNSSPTDRRNLQDSVLDLQAKAAGLEAMISAGEIIKSPVAGSVIELHAAPGDVLNQTQQLASIRTGKSDALWAVAFMPSLVPELNEGMKASLECPQHDGLLEGKLEEIAPTPSLPSDWMIEAGFPATRGHRMRVNVPFSSGLEGDRCTLRIVAGKKRPYQLLTGSGSTN